MAYTVIVADNFHYMDQNESYTHGSFKTIEEAIAASKRIVDEYLNSAYRPGMTATELYVSYTSFGEDPYIFAPGISAVLFSAWDYAKVRAAELCGA